MDLNVDDRDHFQGLLEDLQSYRRYTGCFSSEHCRPICTASFLACTSVAQQKIHCWCFRAGGLTSKVRVNIIKAPSLEFRVNVSPPEDSGVDEKTFSPSSCYANEFARDCHIFQREKGFIYSKLTCTIRCEWIYFIPDDYIFVSVLEWSRYLTEYSNFCFSSERTGGPS